MLITMQSSIWITTMLLHILLFAMTTLSQFTTPTKLTKLTLNLTHTQSPYSLLHDTNMSSLEDIRFPLTRSVDFMLSVPITLGTPPISLELLLDTGSALTWTQCLPCESCYWLKDDKIYDSQASKTFRKLPGDATCSNAKFKPFGKDCIYQIAYGGGTITKGFASYETFSFENGASGRKVMPNILFGCSNGVYNAGPLKESGLISGIMGLNRSPQSLLTQLFPGNNRRLSYCFSPFAYGIKGTKTVMTFGDDVPKNAPALQTPFMSGFDHYQLQLLDISVGNRRLGLSPVTFAPSSKGGGFIIDSGTLIPRIQKKGWFGKPYTTVIAAFKKYYNALGLQKIESPFRMAKLDLCYEKPTGFNKFASMTYHFKGANYVVDGKYTSIVDERNGVFCVAVMPMSEISILGTLHQQNMRLVYDVSMGVLRFGAEECAK